MRRAVEDPHPRAGNKLGVSAGEMDACVPRVGVARAGRIQVRETEGKGLK